MKDFTTIEFEKDHDLGIVWLNRPDIRNAFNEVMINELIRCFEWLNDADDIRIVILRGRGKSFCAGADLNWMRDVASYTYEQNYRESLNLAKCFFTIYTCRKPTIAVVHGVAMGGANGLLAACDIVIADEETTFAFSEVKIGIIPATIGPYILKRTGEAGARELMLTGKRIHGREAAYHRLVNKSLPSTEVEAYLDETISHLRTSGPEAMSRCKELIFDLTNKKDFEREIESTARRIAEIRASKEGQEGMAAFLEKRKPRWVDEGG